MTFCYFRTALRIRQYDNLTLTLQRNLSITNNTSTFHLSSIRSKRQTFLSSRFPVTPEPSIFPPRTPRPTTRPSTLLKRPDYSLWDRWNVNDIVTVPPEIIANVSLVHIPPYLLAADDSTPLLPELLNIDSRVPPIPGETVCLATVTKSYSPLREAVDACATSYSLNNRRPRFPSDFHLGGK